MLDPGTTVTTGYFPIILRTEKFAGFGTVYTKNGYANGTTFMPGDTGVAGSLTLSSGITVGPSDAGAMAKLMIDVLGGSSYDVLAVSGALNGVSNMDLSVNVAAGQNYTGAVLTIVTSLNDLSTQAFHSYSLTNNYLADVAYGVGSVTLLNIHLNHLPGDINGDNIVDQADYTVWYNHYGMTGATWADGDVNGDTIVDQADYTIWYNNYGSTGSNVPEPMTMALLAIGGLALLRRKK
jgi:hypothetical protein